MDFNEDQDHERDMADLEDGTPLSPSDNPDARIANILMRAFEATKLIEIVETQLSPGQVYFMCRVQPKAEKDLVHAVVKPVLLATKGKTDVFFGKQYVLDKTDEIRYAWVVGIGSSDLEQACRLICGVIESILPKPVVMEAPLLGGTTPQGSVKGGRKGASGVPYGA
jgi:hypothetical protein